MIELDDLSNIEYVSNKLKEQDMDSILILTINDYKELIGGKYLKDAHKFGKSINMDGVTFSIIHLGGYVYKLVVGNNNDDSLDLVEKNNVIRDLAKYMSNIKLKDGTKIGFPIIYLKIINEDIYPCMIFAAYDKYFVTKSILRQINGIDVTVLGCPSDELEDINKVLKLI